jgi:cytoskeleton protein RodZ
MTDPAADSPLQQSAPEPTPRDQLPGAANEPAGGPGARLMAERRAQGLSLGDIARQLKLSVRQVEALERDDHAAFSGAVFVRGFLRNYAKLLHLNPDFLLEQISVAAPAPIAPATVPAVPAVRMPTSDRRDRRPRNFGVLGGIAILVVLVLAALYEGRQKQVTVPMAPGALSPSGAAGGPQRAESPPAGLANAPAAQSNLESSSVSPAPPSASAEGSGATPATSSSRTISSAQDAASTAPTRAQPAPAVAIEQPAKRAIEQPAKRTIEQAAKPAPVPISKPQVAPAVSESSATPVAERASVGSAQLHFTFEDDSWVEIKDGTGQVIFAQLGRAGSERTVKGNPPLSVIVGNAHGVRLTYREKVVDLGPYIRVDVARVVLE